MRLPIIAMAFGCSLAAADICGPIRTLVREEVQKQAMPAISAAIVQSGRIICSLAFGFADLEQRVPNTVRSRHRLASLSKPISAVLTMKLVEEETIALADSVRKFMPGLPVEYEAITIRRLLSHQSGIREYSGLDEVFSIKHYGTLEEAAFDASNKYPGGGIISTAADYANFSFNLAMADSSSQPLSAKCGSHRS